MSSWQPASASEAPTAAAAVVANRCRRGPHRAGVWPFVEVMERLSIRGNEETGRAQSVQNPEVPTPPAELDAAESSRHLSDEVRMFPDSVATDPRR